MEGCRLLLAEDDEMLAALLKYRLEQAGYTVDLAPDGRRVREYLQSGSPDAIISDIMMPYSSGIELVDYLRNDMKSRVPVIILSTAGNESNVLSAFELGADEFMTKPVSPNELLVRVRKLLTKTNR